MKDLDIYRITRKTKRLEMQSSSILNNLRMENISENLQLTRTKDKINKEDILQKDFTIKKQ